MKKVTLPCLLFLTLQIGHSQTRKNISIDPGIAFRGAAIALSDKPFTGNPYGLSYSSLKLFRNKSLAIDIQRNIFNNRCFLQLSNYFRYGHLNYEKDATGSREVTRFKHDHFLDIIYKFGRQSPNHIIFSAGAGYGYMNWGTVFTYDKYQGTDASGNPLYIPTKGSFSFPAPRLMVGLQWKQLKGFIIAHGTPDEEFDPNPTLCIETKFTYSIFRL